MNLFNYIKSRLSILDIIGQYTTLRKAGTYWKANCPFHHEKTASFTVSPHKEIFYCFGCHTSGDLISFIAKIENCSQLEAAQHLIETYQIEVPEEFLQSRPQNQDEKNSYFNLCEMVANWCHESLKKSPIARSYLKKRNISDESINTFHLGYFPGGLKSIKQFIAYMQTQSILVKALLEIHILSEGKNVLYSPFEDRIIFPIKNHLGRFCGFGGRIFKENDNRAKYYNSHENTYFNKGSLLFGFDVAKKTIQQTEKIFLVEGYTDCIAMAQHGFKNTAATLGTACTTDHLKILSRHTQQLYLLYDGDTAGKKAIMRLTELSWQVNIEPKVITLPENEDPASFLEKGGNLQEAVEQSKDIFSFFIDTLGQGFAAQSLSKKLQLVEKLLSIIHKIQEPLKKDLILQRASETLQLPIGSLKAELAKASSKGAIDQQPASPENNAPLLQNNAESSSNTLEKRILFAILNNVSLFNEDNEDYLIACLPTPLNAVLRKLKQLKEQQQTLSPDFSQLFELLDEAEKHCVSKILVQVDETIESESFDQLLERFQKKTWKIVVRSVKTKLAKAQQENNTQEIENILNNFSKLKQKLLNKNLVTKK